MILIISIIIVRSNKLQLPLRQNLQEKGSLNSMPKPLTSNILPSKSNIQKNVELSNFNQSQFINSIYRRMKRESTFKSPIKLKQRLTLSRYHTSLLSESANYSQSLQAEPITVSQVYYNQYGEGHRRSSSLKKQNEQPLIQQKIEGRSMLPPLSKYSNDSLSQKDSMSTIKMFRSKSTFHKEMSTKMSFDVEQPFDSTNKASMSLSDLMHQIYGKLNQIFTINQDLGINPIRKPVFQKALVLLVEYLENNIKNQMDQRLNVPILTSLYEKQYKLAKVSVFQTKKSKLKLQNRTVDVNIVIKDYYLKKKQLERQLLQIVEQKLKLKQIIVAMALQLKEITVSVQRQKIQVTQQQKNLQNLKYLCETQTVKYQQLQNNIKLGVKQLEDIQRQSAKIANFLQEVQQDKTLHQISAEYKQIEREICEFACLLDRNAKNKPVKGTDKIYKNWYKQTKLEIVRGIQNFVNVQETRQEANKKNSYFIAAIQEFVNHVEARAKDADYRSQSCKKIGKMIHKWMQVWNLKQKCLIGLRKEFYVDSKKFYQLFDNIQQIFSCQVYSQKQRSTVNEIKKCFEKIELNYKYGNSFY